jgi:hypothetical protein
MYQNVLRKLYKGLEPFMGILIQLSLLPILFVSTAFLGEITHLYDLASFLNSFANRFLPVEGAGLSFSQSYFRNSLITVLLFQLILNLLLIVRFKKGFSDWFLHTTYTGSNVRLRLVIRELLYFLFLFAFVMFSFRDTLYPYYASGAETGRKIFVENLFIGILVFEIINRYIVKRSVLNTLVFLVQKKSAN